MAFQGSLSELPLPDILQLVAVSGKTGSFTIQNGRESGRIFLSEGQIVHAEMDRLQGEEAVYELAIWPEGEFLFAPGEVSVPTTINKSNTSLLMEAARRIDEWQVLAKRVPSTSLVPVFTEEGGTSSVTLSPEEWAVIRKLDERRTIEEIAYAVGSSPFETSKVLYGLITNGLISLSEGAVHSGFERLGTVPVERLAELAGHVQNEAHALLAGHDRAPGLEGEISERLGDVQRAPSADSVLAVIRTAERAVSSLRGPNQARTFIDRVSELVANAAEATGASGT
jgi:Domain of unknown function (DUF4388)